jgi:mono/diheme cytochrome c family protein
MSIQTPIETRGTGIPAWVIGLTVFVLLVGGVYLASNLAGENPAFAIPGASASAPEGSAVADPAVGEQLVGSVTPACTACHGADLNGSGNFPSLHGVGDGPKSENLQQLGTDNPDTWIHLWIDGTGAEVEGIDRGGMPAFGEQLSSDQIDSIVAYLKSL